MYILSSTFTFCFARNGAHCCLLVCKVVRAGPRPASNPFCFVVDVTKGVAAFSGALYLCGGKEMLHVCINIEQMLPAIRLGNTLMTAPV